jgi:hypothetical protein
LFRIGIFRLVEEQVQEQREEQVHNKWAALRSGVLLPCIAQLFTQPFAQPLTQLFFPTSA